MRLLGPFREAMNYRKTLATPLWVAFFEEFTFIVMTCK